MNLQISKQATAKEAKGRAENTKLTDFSGTWAGLISQLCHGCILTLTPREEEVWEMGYRLLSEPSMCLSCRT